MKHVIQNWSTEPFIQGSYTSVFDESEEETINRLKQPIDNKIYFAGEAMSVDNGATVSGAAESSYEAVETMFVG